MTGRGALYALATGQFVVGVTSLSVVGMVAEMRAALGVGTADIALLLTVFAATYALAAPVLQAALGGLPRRALIVGAMALSSGSCFALAASTEWWMVAGARVFMALAAAMIGPTAAAAAASLVPPKRRAMALSIVFGGITLSSVAGIPMSSFLAQQLGWREAWAAVGGAVLLCAPFVWWTVPRGNRGETGSALALLGVLASRAQGLTVGAVAMQFAGGFILYGLISVWLVEEAGLPRDWLPPVLFGYGMTGVLANVVSGPVSGRLGVERTITLGMAATCLGCLGMWASPQPLWAGLAALVCMGASWLMIMAPIQARLVRLAKARAQLALAFNASALYVGMAIGSAVGGALYELEGAGALPLYAASGIAAALAVFSLGRIGEPAEVDEGPAPGAV
ncbi:MAG: MFS transporter [Pseudomonadota bacterium]